MPPSSCHTTQASGAICPWHRKSPKCQTLGRRHFLRWKLPESGGRVSILGVACTGWHLTEAQRQETRTSGTSD